jgi:hypothetical protein
METISSQDPLIIQTTGGHFWSQQFTTKLNSVNHLETGHNAQKKPNSLRQFFAAFVLKQILRLHEQ